MVDNPESQRYEVREDGKLLAVLDYRRLPDAVAFDSVEVEPEYRGQGVGDLLVSTAVGMVRAEGMTVEPHCPFVMDWLAREAKG